MDIALKLIGTVIVATLVFFALGLGSPPRGS